MNILMKQYIKQLYQKRIKVTVMVSMPYLTIVIFFLIKSKVTIINSFVSDSEKKWDYLIYTFLVKVYESKKNICFQLRLDIKYLLFAKSWLINSW